MVAVAYRHLVFLFYTQCGVFCWPIWLVASCEMAARYLLGAWLPLWELISYLFLFNILHLNSALHAPLYGKPVSTRSKPDPLLGPQHTAYCESICNMQINCFSGETTSAGDLRTLFATRADAVIAVRGLWPRYTRHYIYMVNVFLTQSCKNF